MKKMSAVRLCLVRRSSHTATDSHAQQSEGARYFACSKIKFTRCICRRFISRLAMPLRDLPAQSGPVAVPAKKALSTRTTQTPVHSLTFHYDNARLGWNNRETKLTPATVRAQSFGKLWDQPLDGFVNGSPLQVSGINVGGQKRDVVYAATERNSVYALDAASGKVLWSRKQLAPPYHRDGVLRRVAHQFCARRSEYSGNRFEQRHDLRLRLARAGFAPAISWCGRSIFAPEKQARLAGRGARFLSQHAFCARPGMQRGACRW
jgi:hypothetical protein